MGSVRARYWRFTRPLIWRFSAGAALVLALAAVSVYNAREYTSYQEWTVHAYQVREDIVVTLNDMRLAEMEARSYGLTGRDESAVNYYRAMAAVAIDLDAVGELTADNPEQAANLAKLRKLIADRRQLCETVINDYRRLGPAAAHAEVLALINHSSHPIRDLTDAMRARETQLLMLRETHRSRSAFYVGATAAISTLTALALMLQAFFTITSEHRKRAAHRTQPRKRLGGIAERIE